MGEEGTGDDGGRGGDPFMDGGGGGGLGENLGMVVVEGVIVAVRGGGGMRRYMEGEGRMWLRKTEY